MKEITFWNIKDILILHLLKSINTSKFREIVVSFSCFKEFTESELYFRYYQDKIFENFNNILSEADRQIDEAQSNNSRIISYWDKDYPDMLRKITYPPNIIFVKGTIDPNKYAIGIVGTRKATSYGKLSAERFAEFFSVNNITVVSGLAYGIDTYAHLAAVKSGGTTFGVIASGIDCLSPATSVKNSEKMIECGGAIISEYSFGTQANLGSFPQRNRIIAGISKAVVVIECGIKSGALITARIANSESREVFAVPGNISSRTSEGTNKLIKDNLAIIALSPESVLEDLGFNKLISERKLDDHGIKFADKKEELIYNLLNHEPIHIDKIAEDAQSEIAEISSKLLMLEFNGLVKQLPGKYYLRTHL